MVSFASPLKPLSRAHGNSAHDSCRESACKSLIRIEIRLTIYESCDRLESFSRDPIGFKGGGDANIYRYVGGKPLERLDPRGLAWGNNDFFNHYWHGNGQGVTLTSTGILNDFLRGVDGEIQGQFEQGKGDAIAKMHCKNGPGGYSENVTWTSPPGLAWESGLWPLGGTPVNVTRTASVSWNCEQCECPTSELKITSWTVDVTLGIHVHDAWTNPYKVWEGDDTDSAAANGDCCYGCYKAWMENPPYRNAEYQACITDCDTRFPHKGNGGGWGGRPFGITEDITKSKSFSGGSPCGS